MRGHVLVGCTSLVFAACGGGDKKPAKKPEPTGIAAPKPETEEDRAAKRLEQAKQIIPEGSTCLPLALKEENAPQLELGARGADAIVCAVDDNRERLLGPVGCWKVDLLSGALEYQTPAPLPGRGFSVLLDDRCARGYCLPKDAKLPDDKIVHIAWDTDGKKVAVLAGDQVHLFDAESKNHESAFAIRGDKGVSNTPVAVHFAGSTIVVEGADAGPWSAVWVFKADGTPVGPVLALGGKEERPLSTYKGSLSLLDKPARLAVAEKAMETLTVYEVETGKRTKLVRQVGKLACKPAELEAYWTDGDKVSDKCKGSLDKASGHLMGATAVAGATNLLVLLRGVRMGELGVLEPKTLKEKKVIKMPWCEGAGGGGKKEEAAEAPRSEDKGENKTTTRGPVKKDSSDPEEGGE